jgi:hypothetical protein
MQNEEPVVQPAPEQQAEPGKDAEARVTFAETEANAAKLRAKTEEIKVRIAQTVRADSEERAALTPQDDLFELDDDLRYGRIDTAAVLKEMTAEERFEDITVVTSPTGIVFVYSFRHIASDIAAAKSVIEEAKCLLAGVIRTDSLEKEQLTPLADLHAMAAEADSGVVDTLLKSMQTEERYADIKTVNDATGALYYHSDKYLVDGYAATLLMAMSGNHCATIAETVRKESRIYPRTTNLAVFRDQKVYGVPADELDAVLLETLRRSEYCDIKKIVHPQTGAVHLYSERYLKQDAAWAMMDWDEVGRANNP